VTFLWNHHLAGDSLDVRLGGQNRDSFKGVIESIRQKFTLFSPEGIPLRATVNVVLREYRTLDEQLTQLNLKSPDRTRSHTVRGGETLSTIATQEWERPEEWRRIADENEIEDPRRLHPGVFLDIPGSSPQERVCPPSPCSTPRSPRTAFTCRSSSCGSPAPGCRRTCCATSPK